MSLILDESSTSESISITNSSPMSDEEGKNTTAYTFSLINEDSSEAGYILYLDDVTIDDEINRMNDINVKYQIIKNGTEKVGLVSELGVHPFRILNSEIINGNTTDTYSLRFWLKEGAEVSSSQIFSVKIRVIATSKDAIENGKLTFGDTIVTTDSGVTQMSSEQLQTYVDKALSKVLIERYPVGSIYISTSDSNPGELFGGTWERYASGKTLVGVDENDTDFNLVNATGGTKSNNLSHTHTVNSHTHSLNNHTHSLNSHTHGLSNGYANVDMNKNTTSLMIKRQGTVTSWTGHAYTGISVTDANSMISGEHNNAALGGTTDAASGSTGAASGNTGATSPGTNSALNTVTNLQPYITIYMWKRIS